MTLDAILTHFRAGVITQAEALTWITTECDLAVTVAQLALIDKVKAESSPRTPQQEHELEVGRSRGDF